jgi:hypothetical protein
MIAKFSQAVKAALESGVTLPQFAQLLRAHAEEGLTQEEALGLLEELRAGAGPVAEDRLLEYLDIASGFCQKELRVWP